MLMLEELAALPFYQSEQGQLVLIDRGKVRTLGLTVITPPDRDGKQSRAVLSLSNSDKEGLLLLCCPPEASTCIALGQPVCRTSYKCAIEFRSYDNPAPGDLVIYADLRAIVSRSPDQASPAWMWNINSGQFIAPHDLSNRVGLCIRSWELGVKRSGKYVALESFGNMPPPADDL